MLESVELGLSFIDSIEVDEGGLRVDVSECLRFVKDAQINILQNQRVKLIYQAYEFSRSRASVV